MKSNPVIWLIQLVTLVPFPLILNLCQCVITPYNFSEEIQILRNKQECSKMEYEVILTNMKKANSKFLNSASVLVSPTASELVLSPNTLII